MQAPTVNLKGAVNIDGPRTEIAERLAMGVAAVTNARKRLARKAEELRESG
jgi:hypothetical protein